MFSSNHVASDSCPERARNIFQGYGDGRRSIATVWSRSTTAGDMTVVCTTKSPLLAKQRRWEVVMHVHHPFDARLSCRDDDGRRNHQTCDGAAVAMVGSRESVGTYLVLKVKQAQRTNVRAQIGARRTTDDAVD